MWPAAQMPRLSCRGCAVPVNTAGIQSAISTHVPAAANTSGASFLQCRIFDQNHSAEYVQPHLARYSGLCRAACAVISAASAWPVWSFHSHAMAAG